MTCSSNLITACCKLVVFFCCLWCLGEATKWQLAFVSEPVNVFSLLSSFLFSLFYKLLSFCGFVAFVGNFLKKMQLWKKRIIIYFSSLQRSCTRACARDLKQDFVLFFWWWWSFFFCFELLFIVWMCGLKPLKAVWDFVEKATKQQESLWKMLLARS